MKISKIFIILSVIGLVAASLFLISYHATSSQTSENSVVASSRSGNIEGQIKPLAPDVTNVVVVGSSRLDSSLKANLSEMLPGGVSLGAVNFADPSNMPVNAPLLYVQVKEQNVRWTPVYSTAAVQVEVSYSENGDVSFKDTDPVHFQTGTKPGALQFKGTYKLDDVSRGLMSLPGYQDFLAQKAAQAIAKGVQDQLNP